MRKQIFDKARHFLKEKLVEKEGETDHYALFKIKEYQIMIGYKNYELIFSCTCKSGAYNKFCSHVLACFSYLTQTILQGGDIREIKGGGGA